MKVNTWGQSTHRVLGASPALGGDVPVQLLATPGIRTAPLLEAGLLSNLYLLHLTPRTLLDHQLGCTLPVQSLPLPLTPPSGCCLLSNTPGFFLQLLLILPPCCCRLPCKKASVKIGNRIFMINLDFPKEI